MQIALGDQLTNARLEVSCGHLAEVIAEVADESADFVLDILELVPQQLPRCEDGAETLARWCFNVDWLEQTNPHHLSDATRVVAVSLVELGRQGRLHMAGLDANDG